MNARLRLLSLALIPLALACGEDDPNTDAGVDTGMDAGTMDTSMVTPDPDLGTPDAGQVDTGSIDMGMEPPAFTLQLLHFADVDSNEATALDAVDEFSALVDGLRKDPVYGAHSILVSSGDNLIPGPRWFAAENNTIRTFSGSNEPGHADHFIMNSLGVVASALGNHDLDQGPGEFADSMASESRDMVTFPGTLFPYLAANVDFSLEDDLNVVPDGQAYMMGGGGVAKSATVQVGDQTIGLVGVSTPNLPSITTTGNLLISGSTTNIAELAAAVQPTIDALVTAGVNKIIVLAHLQQIRFERALAMELNDVDIIVAGGSNTRMGDDSDALFPGDSSFDEPYPFETMGADGNPLLIVNTDADYKYLGRLVVGFTEDGVIIPDSVDPAISGAFASTMDNVTKVDGTPISDVVMMRDLLVSVISDQYNNVIGHSDVYLEGRRGLVRTEETNLGNLTADANKWYAERCVGQTKVLSLKNGGGIRAEIGNVVVNGDQTTLTPPTNDGLMATPGDVSEGHLRGTLRFDNGLVVLSVTGDELKLLLEHGVAQSEVGVTPGRFPQVGGIWFGFDPTGTPQELEFNGDDIVGVLTPGARVTDIWVDAMGADNIPDTALYIDGVAQAAASNVYPLVTLNFLANGGDQYPFALLASPNRQQLYDFVGFGDPDVDMDDTPDFPVLMGCDPGMQSVFGSTGAEQDALAEYFIMNYPNPMAAFDVMETPKAMDRRIQDLGVVMTFVSP